MSSWPNICGPHTFLHALNIVNIALCMVYLVVYGICMYRYENRKRMIPKKYRRIFVISLISGVASSTAYVLTIISCYSGSPFAGLMLTIGSAVPYHVMWLAIWFNLVLRLEDAFQRSEYALSQNSIVCFKVIGVVMFLLGITQIVIWIAGLHVTYFGNLAKGNALSVWLVNRGFDCAVVIILAEMTIFLVFGIAFGASFISRILRLTKKQISSRVASRRNILHDTMPLMLTGSTNSVALDRNQIKLIQVAARTVVLSFFAVFTTFLIFLVIVYRSRHAEHEQYSYPITTLLQLLDMAINVVCIHLNYAFAQIQYKTLCRPCDLCAMRFIESRLRTYSKSQLHAALNTFTAVKIAIDSQTNSTVTTLVETNVTETTDESTEELELAIANHAHIDVIGHGRIMIENSSLLLEQEKNQVAIAQLISSELDIAGTFQVYYGQYQGQSVVDISYDEQSISPQDMICMVYGACFLASGGGGPLNMGLEFAKGIERNITLIKPQAAKPGNSAVITADLGSPAALIANSTLGRTAPINTTKYMIDYVRNQHGSNLSLVYPIEIGAVNTVIPFVVADKLALTVLDAAAAGRSVPVIADTLLAARKVPCCPAVIAKDTSPAAPDGDPVLFADISTGADELNTLVTAQLKQWRAQAVGFSFWWIEEPNKPDFYNLVNTSTIDIAVKLGKVFLNPMLKPLQKIEAAGRLMATRNKALYNMFRGTLISLKTEKAPDLFGVLDVNRAVFRNEESAEEFVSYGVNENLIAFNLTTKKLQALGPDVITFLDEEDSPVDITSIEEGKMYTVVGVEAWDNLVNDAKLVETMMRTIRALAEWVHEKHAADALPVTEYIPIATLQQSTQ